MTHVWEETGTGRNERKVRGSPHPEASVYSTCFTAAPEFNTGRKREGHRPHFTEEENQGLRFRVNCLHSQKFGMDAQGL